MEIKCNKYIKYNKYIQIRKYFVKCQTKYIGLIFDKKKYMII